MCKSVAMDELPRAPYPEDAKQEKITGEVVLKLTISPDLQIQRVEVVSGPPILADSAVNATKQIRFSHLRNQVEPETCTMNLAFRFTGSAFGEVPRAIRVSESVAKSLLIHKVDPVYPRSDQNRHKKATVVLSIFIDEQGIVTKAKAVSGPPELFSAAEEAVKQWHYKPFVLNGEPASVDTMVTVKFKK